MLAAIVLGCLFFPPFLPKDPSYLDLYHANTAPNAEFLFGTDAMGRDLFSMVWYGGRISLLTGFLSTAISAAAGILLGTASGLAPRWLDGLLMRLTEIFLSIPGLLPAILLQAALGKASVLSLSTVLGLTGWAEIAKAVRTEVRQLRGSAFVTASRCMGGSPFHILRRHLLPNFLPAILFMLVMRFRSAVASESTMSFLGLGLPLELLSWGSLLSLSERSLLSGAWWAAVIPGVFLAATLLCVTELGSGLQTAGQYGPSGL